MDGHHHHMHHTYHKRRPAPVPIRDRALDRPLLPVDNADFPSLVKREDSSSTTAASSSSSSKSCEDGSNSELCEKPTDSATLPIVLAAVIPIVVAIAVLIFIHQRHVKKQRLEDANDKHKSLDFGLADPSAPGGGKKKGGKALPEMIVTDIEKPRRGRGMSLDINSPYLLPAGLQGSRESIHSLSRSHHDDHDPYRPVTFIKDDASLKSLPRSRYDGASTYTGSSNGTDRVNASLTRNAQRMSTSLPSRGDSMSPQGTKPTIQIPEPSHPPGPPLSPKESSRLLAPTAAPPGLSPPQQDAARDSYFDKNADNMRASNNYLGQFIHSREPSADLLAGSQSSAAASQPREPTLPQVDIPPAVAELPPASPPQPHPPRLQSMAASTHHATASMLSDTSDYGDGFKVTPPSPPRGNSTQLEQTGRQSLDAPMAVSAEDNRASGALGVVDSYRDSGSPGTGNNRLSMSMRPLPYDDPADNAEQRANRIRSFYKEYFDDSRPDPSGGYYQAGNGPGTYANEYMDGTIFDPDTGSFVVARAPYAEPVTRRAMTPPPRAPPRFRGPGGGSGGPRGPGRRGHASSASSSGASRFLPPRGQSAMSGRQAMAAGRPRGPPQPPPQPLTSLPTPHMLKEDAMVFSPIDFAPPASFRDRQAGRRPDSPLGVARPYSPVVAPHLPLASSFDELSAVPSPHHLRKSGTFTALDFAPPPRFRNVDSGSDAASIRSSGSGMSATQHRALRAGAYRVSRIPKEVVSTKDDLMSQLKPTWDQRGPAHSLL
ncbi:hypothetical protein BDY21DRAFT_368759 [Lineolata rhizophorae]|uniref:Uncharacterized protein n=1 Tax=Lineolata rhizophorae TaxID=578093 RepID=A0A6A6PC95_9PEZI|nr:hypothetical protein BDY21DRAFT_368759 [Lineolata rhizophorae]